MGRSPSGSKAMEGRESQARSAAGEGWRRRRLLCAGAHPLPNPSPIKGEGLKRAPLPLWERSDGQEPKWLEGHGRPREPSAKRGGRGDGAAGACLRRRSPGRGLEANVARVSYLPNETLAR